MAKGYNKSGFDLFSWEMTRRGGRQLGRRLEKTLINQFAKHTLETDSKFRKAMDRFKITSTLKGSLGKMYEIVDLFQEEYSTTKAVFQKSIYLKDDVKLIDRKFKHVERLVFTSTDENAYNRCIDFWNDIKTEILIKNS